MKFLMLLLLLGLAVFLLGFKRGRRDAPPAAKAAGAAPGPKPMIRCAQCGLHLPESEALPGRGGHFCSAAHRATFEANTSEQG